MPDSNTLNTSNEDSQVIDAAQPVTSEHLKDLERDHQAGKKKTLSSQDKAFVKEAGKMLRSSRKSASGKASRKVENILRKALNHFNGAEYRESLTLTLQATEIDPEHALGYHLMAVSLDKLGEKHKALLMFEKTLELDPTQFEAYLNLASVARDLGLHDVEEKFLRIFIELKPDLPSGYNDLSVLLRDQNRFDDAIDLLRHGINLMPEEPLLWNTMGTIACDTQNEEQAITFYQEALRLDPNYHRARYNLATLYSGRGHFEESLADYDKFLEKSPPNHADTMNVKYARALTLIAMGRLETGWREYQIRNEPNFLSSQLYAVEAPMWNGEDVRGKNILVIGEQGVGDEIMFANPIQDLIDKVGDDGNVLISVTPRLIPLFERAYPGCLVSSPIFITHNGKTVHVTRWQNDRGTLDYYTPMGDLSIFLRPDVDSYRHVGNLLQPDPEEIEEWKARLSRISDGPFVGVCWRSGLLTGGRGKGFAPLEEWGPVFENKQATFVNLQYGEVAEEVEEIQSLFGCTLHQMEGLDIKDNLDSNAALCAALDVVIAAPTAAAALAGSVGTKTWFVITRRGWASLGELDYPFYPDTEVFQQEVSGEWDSNFRDLGIALEKLVLNKSEHKPTQ